MCKFESPISYFSSPRHHPVQPVEMYLYEDVGNVKDDQTNRVKNGRIPAKKIQKAKSCKGKTLLSSKQINVKRKLNNLFGNKPGPGLLQ